MPIVPSIHRRLELLWQSADKISVWTQREREISGHFPATLNASLLDPPWLKEHLANEATPDSYRIDYWVNQPGISYCYTPEKGVDYYPD